jgi:hypothetical protein
MNDEDAVTKAVCKKCALQQQEYCETVNLDDSDGSLKFLEVGGDRVKSQEGDLCAA